MMNKEIMEALQKEIRLAQYADEDYCSLVSIGLIEDTIKLIKEQQHKINVLAKGLSKMLFQDYRVGDTVYVKLRGQEIPAIIKEIHETESGEWYMVSFVDHNIMMVSKDDII